MKDLSSIVAKFKVQGTVEETMPFFRMWKCFNPILPLSQAISVRN